MTDRTARLAEHLRYWRNIQHEDLDDPAETARIAVKFINAEVYPAKLSPYARCSTYTAPLDVPGRPWSEDCVVCMAEAGDPECVEAVAGMRAGEAVTKAGRDVVRHFGVPCCDYNGIVEYIDALRDALPKEET